MDDSFPTHLFHREIVVSEMRNRTIDALE